MSEATIRLNSDTAVESALKLAAVISVNACEMLNCTCVTYWELGAIVGEFDGTAVGLHVGLAVGMIDGAGVGAVLGSAEGDAVGTKEGRTDGADVGGKEQTA